MSTTAGGMKNHAHERPSDRHRACFVAKLSMIPNTSRLDHTPPAAVRSLCCIFQSVQMRDIFAGIPTVWQRCASPINSCQSGTDKQFVQVTTASGYDDCIVASWSENAPPTCVDRERLCKSACREYLRLPAKFDCLWLALVRSRPLAHRSACRVTAIRWCPQNTNEKFPSDYRATARGSCPHPSIRRVPTRNRRNRGTEADEHDQERKY